MMWLLMLACTSEAPPEWSCADLDDPAGIILAAWSSSPDEAETLLLRCEDVGRQRMMLESLLRAHPGQTSDLCDRLPQGSLRSRCTELNARPHLWEERAPITRSTGRAGHGPSSMHPSPEPVDVELALIPVENPCAPGLSPSPCLSTEADGYAREGRASEALSICREEEKERWQSECLFGAAESALTGDRADERTRYTNASALCMEAGDFRTHCLAHLHLQWDRAAPRGETSDGGPWELYRQRGAVIMDVWTGRDQAQYGALAQDYFWSELSWESMARSQSVVGNALDYLPPEAHPHIRAASVYQLMRRRQLDGQDIIEARRTIERVLSERHTDEIVSAGVAPERAEGNLWPQDVSGEEEVPASFYLGVSRRAVDSDPSVDIIICILEAAARMIPVRHDLLEEGSLHPHPSVRWTAERLSRLSNSP